MTVRSPIVVVLGHVDHGKTMVLDRIRGTAVAAREAGAITQHVGASFIPVDVFEKKCGELLKKYKFELNIPGLLFIDTPGHEAFTNLRKRGGSVADLAVLVVDITQGVQQQTREAISILKNNKVPFIVAANKIDLIDGWQAHENTCSGDTIKSQRAFVQEHLDKKIYNLVGQLAEDGFDSERFDRVTDITKQVLIIPISAKTGEGMQELLMFLAGLSQKFMSKKLNIDDKSPAKGVVLEVKETTGLGMTIDAIIFEGCLKTGDIIALAGRNGAFTTKIRALLSPAPLEEIRDTKKKFTSMQKVYAAAGIKIAAPKLEDAISGSPLMVTTDEKKSIDEINKEIRSVLIQKETEGAVLKTDALGSLEAIAKLFEQSGIAIRRADVGAVSKKDVLEAETVRNSDRYLGVVFAFNTHVNEDAANEAKSSGVPIFASNVIYKLEEDYKAWKKDEEKREKIDQLSKYVYPAKIIILPGYVFRECKPAVVGVEVLAGIIKARQPLMNENGETIGHIQSLQEKNKTIEKAEKGAQVAVSIEGATVGRNIKEGQTLYTAVPIEQLYELMDVLDEKELLKEIKKIRKA
ncbi:translation initiation factor IF-2 [Candidatus Micrarchaeota archaeon]|nr:translation initiation factor IF-2 [Candidatus Micrarchaeota archaeon]